MLGEYAIYSADWHGISLLEIARQVGLRAGEVPDDRFYGALYREWAARDFKADPAFRAMKRHLGDVTAAIIRELAPDTKRVLSVGVGLGLLEQRLIEAHGLDVEITECQSESLAELRASMGARMPTTWITSTLVPLPSATYDVAIVASIAYALPRAQLRALFADVARVLRPNGMVVMLEHDIPCIPITWAKRQVRRAMGRRDIPWGWLRSAEVYAAIAAPFGLVPSGHRAYDAAWTPIASPRRWFGMQWPRQTSHGRILTFQRQPAR